MGDNNRQTNSNRILPSTAGVKLRGTEGAAIPSIAKQNSESPIFNATLMEEICDRDNLQAALKRVKQNAGAPGIDGMSVDKLPKFLMKHWPKIRDDLLRGEYTPMAVRRVEIPKPGSSDKRKLGIPCVVDRFIQQAILQILQQKWDCTFSDSSFGFRPGRSAHQAVAQAQSFLNEGYAWVVDIDLEKFFDRVNHDKLMSALAQRIADKRVLKLIRSFLNAGIMENGLVSIPEEGTPQGGPLSPFLSNVVLDELDKELESRGHKFVRYADDCNVYVRSKRAGERVMESVSVFITRKLKLKVNEAKSAVAEPHERKFLGFSFTTGRNPGRRKIAPQSLERFRARVRQITNRNHSKSLEVRIKVLSSYLSGWRGYFGFCQTPSVLRDLDSWIRRRLRCVLWKQWKVYKKRKVELIKRGISPDLAHTTAWSSKGPWNLCHTPGVRMALPNSFFDSLDLPRLEPGKNI
jgi:RNA-directed DNA polymerase